MRNKSTAGKKRVFYLHGLEARPVGEKVDFLNREFIADTPKINYRKSSVYSLLRKSIRAFEPDFLVGSSMGGYLAYYLAAELQLPALLFNPALAMRTSVDPPFQKVADLPSRLRIVLGENDDVVNPQDTQKWLSENYRKTEALSIKIGTHGHRTPKDIFCKELSLFAAKMKQDQKK